MFRGRPSRAVTEPLERLTPRPGKIDGMADPAPDPKLLLREDLSKEYYALLDLVSKYDGWLLVVKGWSVTLSLAGLGLGFQQRHFALFALAAVTGAAFWYLDGLMKGFQQRYYIRMREIEYTSYLINRVTLGGEYGDKEISAPRIDMTWGFTGYRAEREPDPSQEPGVGSDKDAGPTERGYDWRADVPWRRSPQKVYRNLRNRFWLMNVAIPHAVAIALGSALFIAAALKAPGFEQLRL
jgi:hypothetical protein